MSHADEQYSANVRRSQLPGPACGRPPLQAVAAAASQPPPTVHSPGAFLKSGVSGGDESAELGGNERCPLCRAAASQRCQGLACFGFCALPAGVVPSAEQALEIIMVVDRRCHGVASPSTGELLNIGRAVSLHLHQRALHRVQL